MPWHSGEAAAMDSSPAMPERKRRRKALACEQCRRRKVRCDRVHPCSNCVRALKPEECYYLPDPREPLVLPPRASLGASNAAHGAQGSTSGPVWASTLPGRGTLDAGAPRDQHGSDPGGQLYSRAYLTPRPDAGSNGLATASSQYPQDGSAEPNNITSLKDRVRQLEQQLANVLSQQQSQQPPGGGGGGSSSAGQFASSNPGVASDGGKLNKARYVGQGYWMNTALTALLKVDKTNIYHTMNKCKSLARIIKSQRVPSMFAFEFGKHVPTRDVADKLVDGYFRTFETVYRILHVPTFWQDYRRYWENPSEASVVFVIQMQLCMALGTAFYDATCSLRHLAVQWAYEAQLWLMSPAEKGRMNIPGLQTMCLLHLARETAAISGDLVWISAGNLMRSAMYMGLHRDPTKLQKVSHFAAEIRRRLWATILEIGLQCCLDSGGPPLISLTDFDTLPPGNFNDDQLVENKSTSSGALQPQPKPLTSFTQTSIQIALLKSLPIRLAVTRYINDFRTVNSYDETLRLSSELSTAYRSLAVTLQSYRPGEGIGRLRPSTFQLRFVEHMTQRFLPALHQPWLSASQNDPKYYFSRKIMVETSLKLYRECSATAVAAADTNPHKNPSSSSRDSTAGGSHPVTNGAGANQTGAGAMTDEGEPDDFARLSICGSGGYRSVPLQCIGTIGLELLWQLEEENSMKRSMGLAQSRTDAASATGASASAASSTATPSLAMPGAVSKEVLLEAIDIAVRFTMLRMHAGETNVKGHLFVVAMAAQAHALARGADRTEIERAIADATSEQLRRCLELFKELAAASGRDASDRPAPLQGSSSGGGEATPSGGGSDLLAATPSTSVGTASGRLEDLLMGGVDPKGASDPVIGGEWGWEDLMQNQGFFNFNFSGLDVTVDSFFGGL